MKKTGNLLGRLLPGALVLAASYCMSPQVSLAEEGKATVVARPVANWAEPPIQDMTGRGGKVVRNVCAVESRFDNEMLMAILRNRGNEFAIRMFFPTMMFAPGVTYPISLSAGDVNGSYTAVPVYPGTVLVELGKDDALLKAYRDTGTLHVAMSQSAFDMQAGDLDNGIDLLTACGDTLSTSVSSAGVAGPLPSVPEQPTPPSVAQIDTGTPTRVEIADLGGDDTEDEDAAALQRHVQEQMVLKPLKGAEETAETATAAAADSTTKSTDQVKKEVEKSGFSLFSIFGDDQEDAGGTGKITAEEHYMPNMPEPPVPAATPQETETVQEDVAETVEAAPVVAEEAEPVDAMPTETVTAEAMPEEAAPEEMASEDDGRMIVFSDDASNSAMEKAAGPDEEAIEQVLSSATRPMPAPAPATPSRKPAPEVQAQKEAVASADSAYEPDAEELEARLEQVEKRLYEEVERNRKLEMQLNEMNAQPVSGSASIDLNNPDKPAVVPETQSDTTADRVEAARQERERIKHETFTKRMEELSDLLRQAGVRTVGKPAPEGSLDADNNAFSWHTGRFYGGAEFGNKPRDVEFSNLVSAYLDATGQRCQGDFASHLDRLETRATGSIATAEIVCVGQDANSAAAVVLYEDNETFGVISHEGTSEELGSAIQIRDNIASALGDKL